MIGSLGKNHVQQHEVEWGKTLEVAWGVQNTKKSEYVLSRFGLVRCTLHIKWFTNHATGGRKDVSHFARKIPPFFQRKKNVCSPIAVIATGALCGWMAFGETQRMGGDKPGKVPPASSIGDLLTFPKLEVTFSPLKRLHLKKTTPEKGYLEESGTDFKVYRCIHFIFLRLLGETNKISSQLSELREGRSTKPRKVTCSLFPKQRGAFYIKGRAIVFQFHHFSGDIR